MAKFKFGDLNAYYHRHMCIELNFCCFDLYMCYIVDTSKVALPQKGRLEMENHRSTCIPKTSPLPRSELTNITGIALTIHTGTYMHKKL